MQAIDSIDVSEQEAAAIDAQVTRLQQGGERDLTASALLARMTHKIVRGWSEQAVEAQRQALTSTVMDAMRTATPDRVQRALEVLTAEATEAAAEFEGRR